MVMYRKRVGENLADGGFKMLQIEYRNGGKEETAVILNAAFNKIPSYWRSFLGEIPRLVVSGEPLAKIEEVRGEIEEFAQDCEKENASRKSSLLNPSGEACEIWVATDKSPPAIFLYPGKATIAEIMEGFVNACGTIIMVNPSIHLIIEARAFGKPDQDRINYSIWRYFGKFILNIPPESEAQGMALARIWEIDFLLSPDLAHRHNRTIESLS